MGRLLAFSLALFLVVIPFARSTDANSSSIDDLLIPELPSINEKGNQQLTHESNGGENIDELLGPKDIFPFLPDNHRDSGTGKFNSF